MSFYDTVRNSIDQLVEQHRQLTADGHLSVGDGTQLALEAIKLLMKAAQELGGTGAEKKAAVLEALDKAFEEFIRPIDLPIWDVVEKYADDQIKATLLAAASGAIDWIYGQFLFEARLSGPDHLFYGELPQIPEDS